MEDLDRYTLVLLPGLDGTGQLFAGFQACVQGPAVLTARYPTDRCLSITDLSDLVIAMIGDRADIVLVAESYSGRVAFEVARRLPSTVRALVLSASFLCNPSGLPGWLAAGVPDALFRLPLLDGVIRAVLVGPDASDDAVAEVRRAVGSVQPKVLAHRLRDVLRSTLPENAAPLSVPVLYLAGSEDRLVSLRAVQPIRALGLRVEVRMLAAPHLVLQRAPAQAWRDVATFLAALDAR